MKRNPASIFLMLLSAFLFVWLALSFLIKPLVSASFVRTQTTFLKDAAITERLRFTEQVYTPSREASMSEWSFIGLQNTSVPLPPGEWQIKHSSSSWVALISRPKKQTLLLGKAPSLISDSWWQRYPLLLLPEMKNPYQYSRLLYSQDLSQPNPASESLKGISRRFLLLILKSMPYPGSLKAVYFLPSVEAQVVVGQSLRQPKKWTAHVLFDAQGVAVSATYILESERDVNDLINRIQYLRSPIPSKLTSKTIKDLPACLRQAGLEPTQLSY